MEKHYPDAFSGPPLARSRQHVRPLLRTLCLALCCLWGTAIALADDTFRWVEKDGVYTLTGTATYGETATIKVGSFYHSKYHPGSIAISYVVSGISSSFNIKLYERTIRENGAGSAVNQGDILKYGINDVYLEAIALGNVGSEVAGNVQFSSITLPVNNPAVMSASNIYDINGDGKMEFLGSDFRFFSYQPSGLVAMEDTIPQSGRNDTSARLCNLSGNARPDVRYLEGGLVALAGTDGKWKMVEDVSEAPYPCDYNNDGRIDLMHDTRKVYRQAADGTFSPVEIIPITSAEDTLVYNRWESPSSSSSGIGLGNLGGDVGVAIGGASTTRLATFTSTREFYSMDFNRDGHADLIDESTGTLLLNRGNNRFLQAPQSGRLYPRDLNGDFITDYICYDEDTKTVESMVFQADGSVKRQTLMSNLAMDKRIYFCDFNADGYVDVLLPFSHSKATGEYCYLVLAINDGKGNFTINEDNTFRRQLFFIGCADVDNDGCYDILALEKNEDRTSGNDVECDLYWLKGNRNLRFEAMPDVLTPTEIPCSTSDEDLRVEVEAYIGDFDNDGYSDVLISEGSTKSYLYSFSGEAVAVNRAPAAPAAPTLVSDASSGMLQINWQPGTDDLTPTADLTYALRIGTAPGKGDVVYACADEQGRRLNVLPGNMEYNLDKTLNVSGWTRGDYYVAVQAIDATGKGSAWSETAVYRHEVAHAPFYIADKDIATADTAVIAYDGPADTSLTYNWDLDGGTILASEAGGSLLKVVFDEPGQKQITLTVTDADGNTSTPRTADLHVSPVRFDAKEILSGHLTIKRIADVDGDGQLELLTNDGVYQSTADNSFEKAPGIYNTDLSIYTNFAWDYNRDGLVDFIGNVNSYKNNLMLNQGNRRFAVSDAVGDVFFPYSDDGEDWEHPVYDFNNDGRPDYHVRNLGYDACDSIYENTGDWRTFAAHPVANIARGDKYSSAEFPYAFSYADLNGDNLVDMVATGNVWDENGAFSHQRLVLFVNQGDFTFRRIDTDINRLDKYGGLRFADLNNDGVKDIFTGDKVYLSRDGRLDYDSPIDVPAMDGKGMFFHDLDNNGYVDILYPGADYCLYNYGGGEFELQTTDMKGFDLVFGRSADGKPQFMDNAMWASNLVTASSRIANTPPAAPEGLQAVQDEDGYLTISWSAARDAETPACQMRYNLSVKHRGATGDGAYVISPLNGMSEQAAPLPDPRQTIMGTQIRIPVSALPVGTYEVQLQSIDGWLATSPFTAPLVTEIRPKPLLALPGRICRDKSATIRYVGTGGGQVDVDFGADATVIDATDDHTYEVVWSTVGQKTITVTVDGTGAALTAYVDAPLDASFTLPAITLENTRTDFDISNDILMANRSVGFSVKRTGDDAFHTPAYYGIDIERKETSTAARATFGHTGTYTVRMTVSDDGCGDIYADRTIDVLEGMEAPEIALVTVDPATGKNRIGWSFANLPDYVTDVSVYKEGGHYGQFDLIGRASPADGGFTDLASNPAVTTARYRICLNTSFGISTESGTPHQSVHLTVNKGQNGNWNLMWNAYAGRDIDSYRILRGTSPEGLSEIATVAGSTRSYTDLTAPDGVAYYAIAYSAYYEDEWQPISRSLSLASARSNTASAAQAQDLRLAEGLTIAHLETEAVLSEQQPSLHLLASILPASASCRNVNWTVVEGGDLAYVTPQGLLVAYGAAAGQVVVRATTIDGSQLQTELTVAKEATAVKAESLTIYPEDEIVIDGSAGVEQVELTAEALPAGAELPELVWSVAEGQACASIAEDAYGNRYLVGTRNGTGLVEVHAADDAALRATRGFRTVGFATDGIAPARVGAISVSPRVVTREIRVSHMPADGEKRIYIVGTDGRCEHARQTTDTEARIDCGSYAPGVYLLRVVAKGQVVTHKFIKK